jgi:hypothetical protein
MGILRAVVTHFYTRQGGRNKRPGVERINGLWEADEANPRALAIRLLSPDGTLLDGGLIHNNRTISAAVQDLTNDANLPCLVTGALPGKCAVDMPRWKAGSIRQEDFLPEYPCRRHGETYHSAIHGLLVKRFRGEQSKGL